MESKVDSSSLSAAAAAVGSGSIDAAAVPAWVAACGRLAPLCAIVVFMAPIPTLRQVSKDKSVGNLPLLPYSSMIANGFVWVMYGLLKNESKILLPNTVGVILGLYYFVEFRRFCPKSAMNLPGTMSQHVNGTLAIVVFNILLALIMNAEQAAEIIGKEGVVFCVILFGSPLAALKAVIETRSAKSIPLPFTLACVLNCALWSVAGVLEMHDFNVYFPNLLGLSCGLAQLALKFLYRAGGSRAEVELPP